MYHTVGSKYEETKHLDIREIAKLIRSDLKEAYPEVKFSVRIERFAGGQAINLNCLVDVIDSKVQEAVNGARKIVEAYNFDDSDSMSDYYHVRFYSHVTAEIR